MTDEQVKKESKVICPVKIWPMRLRASLVVLFLTFLVAALIVILKDDLVNKKIDELEKTEIEQRMYLRAKEYFMIFLVVGGVLCLLAMLLPAQLYRGVV